MEYLTRLPDSPIATPADCASFWRDVEALRVVQTMLARDLVRARRCAPVISTNQDVAELNTALTFISAKLVEANLSFYEAVDSARHASRGDDPPPHGHTHARPT